MPGENDPLNPKDAIANTKLPLHLWPASATALGSLGIYEGMLKYGRTNWRAVPVKASVYIAALKRHIASYEEGENANPKTDGDHLGNALACLAILVDARTQGTIVDDRNFNGSGYLQLVETLGPQIENLQRQYGGLRPRHYTIADNRQLAFQQKADDGYKLHWSDMKAAAPREREPIPISTEDFLRSVEVQKAVEEAYKRGINDYANKIKEDKRISAKRRAKRPPKTK